MNNKDIKLIALDMDETLLTSEKEVSQPTKDKVTEALTKGAHVVLSTGRWIDTCHPFAKSLNLTSYLITVNGGEIWTVDKELKEQHLFDASLIENIWELGAADDMDTWMVSTENIWYNSRPDYFHHHEWLKIGFASANKERLDQLVEELSHHKELELTNSMRNNVEINPAGVNKASALEKVCDWLGITMDQVMAAGDSLNDMKMIEQAGIGVAMKNGQEAIKNVADYVTESNNQDGVASAIQRFVLKE